MKNSKCLNKDEGYTSHDPRFRSLTKEEVFEFRYHAQKNYQPGTEINKVWHPIYRDECLQMNTDL